jgi:CRP/FNR family transcriptional regulator, cyclic AMP receptor protein
MDGSTTYAFRSWRDALGHPLLDRVREEHVAPVLRETAPRQVPAGTVLNTPGTLGSLHLVLRGRLQAYRLTPNGHQLLLEIVEVGGVDGVLPVAGQPGHFTQALIDSVVLSLSRERLQRLIDVEPCVGQSLLRLAAARLEAREEQMESMAGRGVPALARLLLALGRTVGHKNGSGVVLEPRLTHQMLADMLGVRRETVSMQFPELTRRGGVQTRGGHFILNCRTLQYLADPEAELTASLAS